MRTFNFAALGLAALILGGCSGSAPQSSSTGVHSRSFNPAVKGREARISEDTLAGFGYHELWDAEIGSPINQIWFIHDDLYVESRGAGGYDLLKVDGDSGLVVWTYRLSESLRFEPCVFEYPQDMRATHPTELFLVQGHEIACLAEADGLKLYDIKCDGAIATPVSASIDYVYVGFWDNYFTSFGKASQIREGWHIAEAELVAPAVVGRDRVYVGSEDMRLYALSMVGEFMPGSSWMAQTNGRITSQPTFYNGQIFVGSHDYKVYCFDTFDGRARWAYNSVGPIPDEVFPFKETIFAVSSLESIDGSVQHTLNSLDIKSGRPNWTSPGFSRILAADALHCYATVDGSSIAKLRHSDGKVDRELDTSKFRYVIGQDAKQGRERDRWGRMYLATPDGYVQLIQPRR